MNLADIAVNLGLPCFPCGPDKAPIIAGGFKAAATDPATIARMFSSPAAQMIGVPTGGASGWVVVDVDVKSNQPGMAWLDANAHRLPSTRTHRTRSGGLHLVFLAPLDAEIRNSASRVAPGVDVRGEGGFVIVPPSPGYAVADATPPAEMPGWLVQACMKPEPVHTPQPYTAPAQPPSDRYAAAALDGECRAITAIAPGMGRNNQLNISAVKLGSLVAAGALDRSAVESALTHAALTAGLDPVETRKTLASGLGFGMQNPRQMPERSSSAIDIRIAESRRDAIPLTSPQEGEQPQDTKPLLPLIYFGDVAPNLDAADFIEGVLIEGAMSVIYGPSNCGKTFFATDLAMHVATGTTWRGREIEAGGVIYCALEGSHGISNRIAAFKKAHKLEGCDVPFAIIPVALDLLDPDADTSKLIQTIGVASKMMGCPVKWTIMDTLSRAMAGGNENSPEDMGALVRNGSLIQQATGSHVTWIHHSGKDQAAGARGHSLLRAATDTEIEINRESKDAPSVAVVQKQREMEIEGKFVFALKTVELGTNRRGKPVTSCVVEIKDESEIEATDDGGPALTGDQTAALRILTDLLAEPGRSQTGAAGTPPGAQSVPAAWWRDRFYARAKAGATEAAKQKAFRRAADQLADKGRVCMDNNRVWLP